MPALSPTGSVGGRRKLADMRDRRRALACWKLMLRIIQTIQQTPLLAVPAKAGTPYRSVHNVFRLFAREQTTRDPVYRVDLGLGPAGLGAHGESGPRVYRKIRCRPARLVRGSRDVGSSDATGKADQELETGLENRAHRREKSALDRSLREHIPMRIGRA